MNSRLLRGTARRGGPAVVFVVLAGMLSSQGCTPVNPERVRLQERIRECCPRPEWWSRIEGPHTSVRTVQELFGAWQRNDRDDDVFFKTAYEAILDYPDDEHLLMNALNLIPNVAGGYEHTRKLLELGLELHFDYDRPLGNYAGKSGDTVAGIVRDLAGIYIGSGEPGRALALIERLLAEREAEINDQMLELLALQHAGALADLGRSRAAVEILDRAITRYHGDWEPRLREARTRYSERSLTPPPGAGSREPLPRAEAH